MPNAPFCRALGLIFGLAYVGFVWLEIFVKNSMRLFSDGILCLKIMRAICGQGQNHSLYTGKNNEKRGAPEGRQRECEFKAVALNCLASSMYTVKRKTDQE